MTCQDPLSLSHKHKWQCDPCSVHSVMPHGHWQQRGRGEGNTGVSNWHRGPAVGILIGLEADIRTQSANLEHLVQYPNNIGDQRGWLRYFRGKDPESESDSWYMFQNNYLHRSSVLTPYMRISKSSLLLLPSKQLIRPFESNRIK